MPDDDKKPTDKPTDEKKPKKKHARNLDELRDELKRSDAPGPLLMLAEEVIALRDQVEKLTPRAAPTGKAEDNPGCRCTWCGAWKSHGTVDSPCQGCGQKHHPPHYAAQAPTSTPTADGPPSTPSLADVVGGMEDASKPAGPA
jgi:hypothetical protein